MRRLFTRAKAATKREAPDPPPKTKKRSTGEDTGRAAVVMAARRITRSAARFSRPPFAKAARRLGRPAGVSRSSHTSAVATFLSDTCDWLAGASLDNGPFDPTIDPCGDFGIEDNGPWDDLDPGTGSDPAAFGPTEPNHLSPNL